MINLFLMAAWEQHGAYRQGHGSLLLPSPLLEWARVSSTDVLWGRGVHPGASRKGSQFPTPDQAAL